MIERSEAPAIAALVACPALSGVPRLADSLAMRVFPSLSDFVYQKSLDTVQKRHHVRLWKVPQAPDVWRGAAAEDIGFRFKLTHWTHSTAPNIDNERAKIVNDLAFTGCLDAVELLSRRSPDLVQDPKGKQMTLTDNGLAVVRMNVCNDPNIMQGVDHASIGGQRGPLSRGLGALSNDLRRNIAFTAYNTLKLVTERRKLKPLRKSPSTDSNPPGLDWLSSMPTEKAAVSSSARQPEIPTITFSNVGGSRTPLNEAWF